jgi:hypothetical protein
LEGEEAMSDIDADYESEKAHGGYVRVNVMEHLDKLKAIALLGLGTDIAFHWAESGRVTDLLLDDAFIPESTNILPFWIISPLGVLAHAMFLTPMLVLLLLRRDGTLDFSRRVKVSLGLGVLFFALILLIEGVPVE